MKQAFEKIIERLKRERDIHKNAYDVAILALERTGYASYARACEEAIEIVNQVAEEYVPDENVGEIDEVCEWKREVYYDKCPHEEGLFKRVHYDESVKRAFNYCPYCGKKIKVVE